MAFLERFIRRLDDRIDGLEALSARYSRIRLAWFLSGAAATVLAYGRLSSGGTWLVAGAVAVVFIVLVKMHDAVLESLRRHRTYRRIKSAHVARRQRDWGSLGAHTPADLAPDHPFAWDLDIVGARSLHHLVDTSFSQGGSQRLADWLTGAEPDPLAARMRQALVRELRPLSALRDRIALLSSYVGGGEGPRFDGEVLMRWLERHRDDERMLPVLRVLWILAMGTAALVGLQLAGLIGAWWGLTLTTYVLVYLLNGKLYSHLFDEAEHLNEQLQRFRPVVDRLESYRFEPGTHLASHLGAFQATGQRPSVYLRRARRLAMAASAQKSELLRFLANIAVPWDLHFAYRLSKCKAALRGRLPEWLDTIYSLEAAGSLATHAWLHPESCFPVMAEASMNPQPEGAGAFARPWLEVEGLGHPLLTRASVVRNDFAISGAGKITVITGSNMSGKSTFLRAVGMAQVMAAAGGPVDARRCSVVPMRVLSSMGIRDSVTDGISFFYAEVKRLAAIVQEVSRPGYPALVLIDEIFRGTNNRERLVGSQALLQALSRMRCAVLVATHDLDLVRLAEDSEAFENRHFREDVVDGQMVFDYRLHRGPCPTTNALKIMAAAGLPVPKVTE